MRQKPSSLEFLVTELTLLTTVTGIFLGAYHIKQNYYTYKGITELSIEVLAEILTTYLIYKNVKRNKIIQQPP